MTMVEGAVGGAPTLVTDCPLMVGPLNGPPSTGRRRRAGWYRGGCDGFQLGACPDRGESLARMKIGIEAADKSFVVGTESGDDGRQAGFDLLGLLRAKVVIEQNDSGKREGFGREKFDALLDVVVQDAEFVALQVGDQASRAVLNGAGRKT